MKYFLGLNPRRPWRCSLIATTGLTLFLFVAARLWTVGLAEWAFVLAFLAVWILLSALWSNDEFIEESNQVLAEIVDHNFDNIAERIKKLEQEIEHNPTERLRESA